jgi:hypothetical protein
VPTPQQIPADFKPFARGFPTRENCDPRNPYEAFLWMLVALPYQQGAQLAMPIDYLQFVSKRLWDCGVRPVAEPTVKYRAPKNLDPNWMTAPGTWVGINEPDPPPQRPVEKAVDGLLNQQQAEVFEEIYRRLTPGQRMEVMAKIAREAREDRSDPT